MKISGVTMLFDKKYHRPFKIRSKTDAKRFLHESMMDGECTYFVNDELLFTIKKNGDNISIVEKWGNLYNPFNPTVEVANTGNPSYKESVYDVVYKYRKYINDMWFNNKDN